MVKHRGFNRLQWPKAALKSPILLAMASRRRASGAGDKNFLEDRPSNTNQSLNEGHL